MISSDPAHNIGNLTFFYHQCDSELSVVVDHSFLPLVMRFYFSLLHILGKMRSA